MGRIRRNKTLQVKIPAGIDDGMRIRSSGNGEPGINGGPPGDLYVEIHIKKHQIFQRDGDDLHCELTIPFTTAALGGEQVPTLGGKAEISIPEGTQSGKTFRLRGKGIRGVRGSYPGDLYCHVVVETPVRLSDEQKNILRQFEASERRRRPPFAAKQVLDRPGEGILQLNRRIGRRSGAPVAYSRTGVMPCGIFHRRAAPKMKRPLGTASAQACGLGGLFRWAKPRHLCRGCTASACRS